MKKAGLSSILIAAALLAVAVIAEAQEPKKVARICFLGASNASTEAIYVKPFRERLREIGYVEEQNFTIEYRFSEGKVDRLPDLAAELVRLSCDVIVTTGTEAAEVAKKVIKTIPVVMAFGGMPKGVASSRASRTPVETSRG
jgi:putative tryptophan/tyrosine transport system substrate-binding protein